jgi:hypothetical protein
MGTKSRCRKDARRAARLRVVGRSVAAPLGLGVGAPLGPGVGLREGTAVVGTAVVGAAVGSLLGTSVSVAVVGAFVGESVEPDRVGDSVMGIDVGVHKELHAGYCFCSVAPQAVYMPFL